MKGTMGDVVAEPVKDDEMTETELELGIVRRASLDSVDRVSLASSSTTTTSSSVLSGGSELGSRTLRSLKRGLGKLWRRHRGNASITEYDPTYKVAYLGNVLTGWAKGEGCVEKPVSTLWRNYTSSNRPDVSMRLTVTNGGLVATTKDHGLTEYWAHRVTYCTAPASHPRLFVWVYRHEGRRLRPELRCHAALCAKESTARRLASILNARLHQALLEFRRDKVSRQNARLSLANAVYENPSLPRRKLLLSTGGSNYRPPLERSKSAPKLSAIEEDAVAEELEQQRFLEELRTYQQRCAVAWQEEQESWRLARLLDSLHQRESSDENASISSGCETASTANSEERVSGSEDSQMNHDIMPDLLASGQRTSGSALTEAMTAPSMPATTPLPPASSGPRRNSEGSAHFMTCAGSPRFRRRSARNQRCRSRSQGPSGFSLPRSEGEESMEEEEEEDEDMPEQTTTPTSSVVEDNFFVFEDVDDMDEIVDFSPHGESPRNSCAPPQSPHSRLQNDSYAALIARREDVRKLMSARRASKSRDDIDGRLEEERTMPVTTTQTTMESGCPIKPGTNFHALGSLDEEEADSDESGYVEASPKSSMDRAEIKCRKDELDKQPDDETEKSREEVGQRPRIVSSPTRSECSAEFIKCPISETIKKLANASLRSSKAIKASTNACLESLGGAAGRNVRQEIDGESPSLMQRKRLLAQQGVTV